MRARQGHMTSPRYRSWPITSSNFGLRRLHLLLIGTLACLVTLCSAGPRLSSRIVETKTGSIRGVLQELPTKHLDPVEVFRAVPYAQPPVKTLRFERPQKLQQPWQGIKLADTFAPVCPQLHPDVTNRTEALLQMPLGRFQRLKRLLPLLVNQSEDCLTLNIYVPGSGNRGLEAPYAVFFFIHGESFEWGSGNPYDGSVLASYGHVIVITVNFRLGILGFLKTRSRDPLGNLGVQDIIVALQWTKENIAAFGGDPSRVTIVGQGTGAALANLILVAKDAKGLIHRAILLSGSALSPWAMAADPDATREEVSRQMACHLAPMPKEESSKTAPQTDAANDVTECLKSKPLEALMGIRLPLVRFMSSWSPHAVESPADPDFAMEHSGESFITTQLMLGMTTMESYGDLSAADIQYGLEEEQRNRVLRTFVRNAFTFHLNEIFSAVRNEYTDWDKPIQHPINIRDSTMEALSDGHTIAPLMRVGYLHARRGAKTYIFHFNYQTKDSEYPQRLGSVRGEDIPYIFGLPLATLGQSNTGQNYSRQDMGVAEAVVNFVTNFCKTGDPNHSGHQQALLHPDYGTERERTRYRGLTWETYEPATQQYLSISSKPKMKSHYRGHKMALWLNLIPQLHRPGDTEVSMAHHHFREKESTFFDGPIRPESFTRPRGYFGQQFVNSAEALGGGARESRQDPQIVDCLPDESMLLLADDGVTGGSLGNDDDDFGALADGEGGGGGGVLNEEEEELIQRFMRKHYFSYTAALGVTVGVGCLLLILNVLIFAGIYYQRHRSRRKSPRRQRFGSNDKNGSGGGGATPVEGRSLGQGNSSDLPENLASFPPDQLSASARSVELLRSSSSVTTNQINRNISSETDSPPTYSLVQDHQDQFNGQKKLRRIGSQHGSPSSTLCHPQQFSPGQATMDRLSNATQVGGGARTVDELSGVQAMPLWTYKYSPEGGKSTGPLNLHPYLDSGDCTMSKIMQEPEMGHRQTTFGANHGNSSGNNNVSILSSILVTNGQGSSADNPGGGRGTLKKRVQIQELPM